MFPAISATPLVPRQSRIHLPALRRPSAARRDVVVVGAPHNTGRRQPSEYHVRSGRADRLGERRAPDILTRYFRPSASLQPADHAARLTLQVGGSTATEDHAGMRPEIARPQGDGGLDLGAPDRA